VSAAVQARPPCSTWPSGCWHHHRLDSRPRPGPRRPGAGLPGRLRRPGHPPGPRLHRRRAPHHGPQAQPRLRPDPGPKPAGAGRRPAGPPRRHPVRRAARPGRLDAGPGKATGAAAAGRAARQPRPAGAPRVPAGADGFGGGAGGDGGAVLPPPGRPGCAEGSSATTPRPSAARHPPPSIGAWSSSAPGPTTWSCSTPPTASGSSRASRPPCSWPWPCSCCWPPSTGSAAASPDAVSGGVDQGRPGPVPRRGPGRSGSAAGRPRTRGRCRRGGRPARPWPAGSRACHRRRSGCR
jgi:hypothetical protein